MNEPSQDWRPVPPLLAGLAYGLAVILSNALSGQAVGVSMVWFGSAVGVLCLLGHTPRQWLAPLAGLATGAALAEWILGSPPAQVPVFIAANLIDIMLAAALIQGFSNQQRLLSEPLHLFRTLLLVALVPSALSGLIVAAVLMLLDQVEAPLRLWIHWVEGALIGHIAVLPLGFCLLGLHRDRLNAAARFRIAAQVMMAAGASLLCFLELPHPFVFVALLAGIIAAREGLLAAAVHALVLALLTVLVVRLGLLTVPASTWQSGDLFLFLPLLATLLPPLLLGAATDGYRRLVHDLSQLYERSPALLLSLDDVGQILRISDQCLTHLGMQREAIVGRHLSSLLAPDQRLRVDSLLANTTTQTSSELVFMDAGGRLHDMRLSMSRDNSAAGGPRLLMVLNDVTDVRQLAHSLAQEQQRVLLDPLTGLGNRRTLDEALAQACAGRRRTHQSFGVGFLDLDEFKQVNDSHGHAVGDQLLIEVARRLRASVRTGDRVFRISGDEFVLILEALPDEPACAPLASKIVEQLAAPFQLGNLELNISASLGVELYPLHGTAPDTLLQAADNAMYQAKAGGRKRWRIAITPAQ